MPVGDFGWALLAGAMLRAGLIAFAGFWLAMPGRLEAAGSAYQVDDVNIAKPGSCHNEAWLAMATSGDFNGANSPACVFMIGLPVEFTAVYQRSRAGPEWSTVPQGQVKIAPISNDHFAFGLAGGFVYDSLTRTTSWFINVPVTFKFGKDFRVHADIGWLHDRRDSVDYLTGGVGFEWDFAPMLSLQGEIFMQEGRSRSFIPASVTQPRPQLGLRVTPVSTVDMDFIYGHNVNGQSAHWWTLGFTVRSQ